jgi:tripartite ATP-independent transporter DctP family solute receptor
MEKIHRRKLLQAGAGLAAASAGIFSIGRTQAAQAKVLRIGHTLSTESHWQNWSLHFAGLVKEKTAGRYEVQIFPQSQLGGEIQMLQALRAGIQDLIITAQAAVDPTVPNWQMFDVPYLFGSIDEANRVLALPIGRKFLDMTSSHGLTALGWGSVVERDVFTASKPIKSLDDMHGLKLRVIQSPGYIQAYRALGANPVPLAYNELYLALKEGTVDGADTTADQMAMDKFFEISKSFSRTRVNYLPVAMLASKRVWEALPAADRNALNEAAAISIAQDCKVYGAGFEGDLNVLRGKGVTIYEIDTAPWVKATEEVRQQLIGGIENGNQLYDELQKAKAGA